MSEREEKIKFIESLLDFVNADLRDDASPDEKMEWSRFFFRLMGPLGAIIAYSDPSFFPTDEDWKAVLAFQETWNIALNWFLAHLEVNKGKVGAIYYEVPRYFTWGSSNESEFSHRIHPCFEDDMLEARIYDNASLNNPDFYGARPDRLSYIKRKFPPGFLAFIEALSGFPRASLKACLHCNTIFFTPNNLRKVYHSLHCQKVASVYRSRRKKKLDTNQDE